MDQRGSARREQRGEPLRPRVPRPARARSALPARACGRRRSRPPSRLRCRVDPAGSDPRGAAAPVRVAARRARRRGCGRATRRGCRCAGPARPRWSPRGRPSASTTSGTGGAPGTAPRRLQAVGLVTRTRTKLGDQRRAAARRPAWPTPPSARTGRAGPTTADETRPARTVPAGPRARHHDGAMTSARVAGLVLTPGASAGRDHSGLVAIDHGGDGHRAVGGAGRVPRARQQGSGAPTRRRCASTPCARRPPRWRSNSMSRRTAIAVGGRSFGGRMCSMAVAEGLPVAALVLVSYPLHPPGKPERLRTEHFPALDVPCLFVSGRRDAFATLAELERETGAIPGAVSLVFVEGDHSLRRSESEVAEVVAALAGRSALRSQPVRSLAVQGGEHAGLCRRAARGRPFGGGVPWPTQRLLPFRTQPAMVATIPTATASTSRRTSPFRRRIPIRTGRVVHPNLPAPSRAGRSPAAIRASRAAVDPGAASIMSCPVTRSWSSHPAARAAS